LPTLLPGSLTNACNTPCITTVHQYSDKFVVLHKYKLQHLTRWSPAVIWCVRSSMCVMDLPAPLAVRTNRWWHATNGQDRTRVRHRDNAAWWKDASVAGYDARSLWRQKLNSLAYLRAPEKEQAANHWCLTIAAVFTAQHVCKAWLWRLSVCLSVTRRYFLSKRLLYSLFSPWGSPTTLVSPRFVSRH